MEFAVEIIQDAPPPDGEDCCVMRSVLEAYLCQDDGFRLRPNSMPFYTFNQFRDLQSRLQSAPIETWAIVPTPHYRARRRRGPGNNVVASPEEQAKARVRERFPHLQELLNIGRRKVVAAGAAMMLMALDGQDLVFQQQHGHCELFFHHVADEDEATALLQQMVALLSTASNSVETPRCKVLLTRTAAMLQVSLCQST